MTSPRLTREQIDELRSAVIDSHIESIYLHTKAGNGNGESIAAYSEMISADYDVREFTREELHKACVDLDNSNILRWWANRLNASMRGTSVDPDIIDQWLARAMSFNMMNTSLNEYVNEGRINSHADWLNVFNQYPFSRILVLWQVLSINIYISNEGTDKNDNQSE